MSSVRERLAGTDVDQPIEDYGIIGDLHSVALVGKDGSVDFLSFPHFDSATIFARLVDHDRGGHFSICPSVEPGARKQIYLPDTNVLITRFLSADGVSEVCDFMPVGLHRDQPRVLIRRLKAVRGTMSFDVEFAPRFAERRGAPECPLGCAGCDAAVRTERLADPAVRSPGRSPYRSSCSRQCAARACHSTSRTRYQKVSDETGDDAPSEHFVKGLRGVPGRHVMVEPEDLEPFIPVSTKTIDLEEFVDIHQIDPVYFEKPLLRRPAPHSAGC